MYLWLWKFLTHFNEIRIIFSKFLDLQYEDIHWHQQQHFKVLSLYKLSYYHENILYWAESIQNKTLQYHYHINWYQLTYQRNPLLTHNLSKNTQNNYLWKMLINVLSMDSYMIAIIAFMLWYIFTFYSIPPCFYWCILMQIFMIFYFELSILSPFVLSHIYVSCNSL